MADLRGVVVIAEFFDEKSSNSTSKSSSCSGILLNSFHGIVLTTASLLSTLFTKTATPKPKLNFVNRLSRLVGRSNGDVEKRNLSLKNVNFSVIIDRHNGELHVPVKYNAKLVTTVKCSSAIEEFENLMRDNWTPVPPGGKNRDEIIQKVKILTAFLVLQIQDDNYSAIPLIRDVSYNIEHTFQRCLDESRVPRKGDKICCESSLFGDLCPTVFMNSLSEGVIVNTFGSLFLIDARCVPGSEGGLVFQKLQNRRRLWIGIIVAALSWNQKEIIGLSVACSSVDILKEILRRINLFYNKAIEFPIPNGYKMTALTRALRSVVIVKNGLAWGSGIVIDRNKKIIITCSHVIQSANSIKVQVHYPEIRDYEARVVYKMREEKVPDIAVLSINENVDDLTSVEVCGEKIKLGDEVLAAGFPIFPPFCRTGVHVTGGVVSRIVSSNGVQILMQTSCCVVGGASGGLILHSKSGLGIGMIVCNAKDSKTSVTFPHVNLAVPLNTIYPILAEYLKTGDEKVLCRLENEDNNIERLWKLGKIDGVPDSKL